MPTYWRNKIYTEEEREKLWTQKLDKEERYILGRKIDVSKTQANYENALKYARQLNQRLGYGNNEKNHDQEQYERQRRIIMQQTRIAKAKQKQDLQIASPAGQFNMDPDYEDHSKL